MKLVRLPEPGSILVNADLPPSPERKERLKKLSEKHMVYLLGTESAAYTGFVPEAIVLDEYVRRELYLLPEAWKFFEAFESYEGNQAQEYDVTGKIYKAVKENIP